MLRYFPFTDRYNDKMGTAPLTAADQLVDVDEHYVAEIALKRQLLAERPDYYFRAETGTEAAQWEALALVLENLAQQEPATGTPERFRLEKQGATWHWENRLLGENATFSFGETPDLNGLSPLDWVGRQVQEDLLLLDGDAPNLVAGQLCFGSGWAVGDKLGLPFWDVHGPVTAIAPQMLRSAEQFMRRLPAGRPFWRLNWSIRASAQLDLSPRHNVALAEELAQKLLHITPETAGEHLWVRIERQTLTRLPQTGAVLFTIHTYQSKLADEAADPDRARRLLATLQTAPPDLLDYKGMRPFLEPLVGYLASSL